MSNIPWQPLYSVERSGHPEVTVYGLISVVEGVAPENFDRAGSRRELLAVGDTNHQLWSRSLLKPWQLISHLNEVQNAYPALRDEHLTLMMSSHSCEELHLKLLGQIMEISGLSDNLLRCPSSYPLANETRLKMKEYGQKARSLYHTCSGKHFGYVLAQHVLGLDSEDYLDPAGRQFHPLVSSLSTLNGRDVGANPTTTDGCQLPNYRLSPKEMASMYQLLASHTPPPVEGDCADRLKAMPWLGRLMRTYPLIIGGTDRFDSKLMSGNVNGFKDIELIAKDGADGMLGVGVAPTEKYPHGLGILIKASSGYDSRHMEALTREIFRQLGLLSTDGETRERRGRVRTDHLVSNFHFGV